MRRKGRQAPPAGQQRSCDAALAHGTHSSAEALAAASPANLRLALAMDRAPLAHCQTFPSRNRMKNPNLTRPGLGAITLCLTMTMSAADAGTVQPAVPAEVSAQAFEILKRSIAFRTFPGEDQVPEYASYLAEVLKAGGFAPEDITITPFEETAIFVARYR